VNAYKNAISALRDALFNKGTPEHMEKELKHMLAVCWANCAAAWLLGGPNMDPLHALAEAKQAEDWDADYAKA
jgi:hypothetical protein